MARVIAGLVSVCLATMSPAAATEILAVGYAFEPETPANLEIVRHTLEGREKLAELPFHWSRWRDLVTTWHPDGQQAVVAFGSGGGARELRDLLLVSLVDGTVENLTDSEAMDRQPSFSPGGDRIAFVSDVQEDARDHYELVVLEMSSGEVARWTDAPGRHVSWQTACRLSSTRSSRCARSPWTARGRRRSSQAAASASSRHSGSRACRRRSCIEVGVR